MEIVILASTLVINEKGEILMVIEKKEITKDKYSLPGGHLEAGETIMEGAKREAREEACIDVELTGLIGVYQSVRHKNYVHFVFKGTIQDGIPKANESEVKAIQWMSLQKISELSDEKVVAPRKLERILKDLERGDLISLDLIHHFPIEK